MSEPIIRIGDRFRLTIPTAGEDADIDQGIRSPLLRVIEIRRDDRGIMELIAEAAEEGEP